MYEANLLTTPPTHLSRFLFMMSAGTKRRRNSEMLNGRTTSGRPDSPVNSWWEFLQCRNIGSLVASARSNCFSKYLPGKRRSRETGGLLMLLPISFLHKFYFFSDKHLNGYMIGGWLLMRRHDQPMETRKHKIKTRLLTWVESLWGKIPACQNLEGEQTCKY